MVDPDGLLGLWGFAQGAHVEVVTKRGVLIPLACAKGWTVVDLATLLGEIDGLPEAATREGEDSSSARERGA